jgi:hypothetical protein
MANGARVCAGRKVNALDQSVYADHYVLSRRRRYHSAVVANTLDDIAAYRSGQKVALD